MIEQLRSLFALHTKRTTYCFHVTPQGFLQHLHYGKRIDLSAGYGALVPQKRHHPANTAVLEGISLEDTALEISTPCLGDVRESFLKIRTAQGDILTDFRFEGSEIVSKKPTLPGLPTACDEDDISETLAVFLTDKEHNLRLTLLYTTFDECDVITRSAVLQNLGSEPVTVLRLMSNQVDLDTQDLVLTSFNGAWGREFEPTHTPCGPGTITSGSRCGVSSNRANPFVMLHAPHADEDHGACYGFHLLYSGDHMAYASGNAYGSLRFLHGMASDAFSWQLDPGKSLAAPEAAMTFADGFAAMSRGLHHFIREHIVRGIWKKRPRPVLVNSWESLYFKFTHRDLVKLAKQGKELGAELFVLDDGWFGKRDSDTCSLGDWTTIHAKKLPHGLKGLAEEINAMGMLFGLWVEPEMVSADSDLYRAHPDWILGRPAQAVGRNQYVLDLGRTDVQEHLISALSQVFSSANISYVKWDMNRILTDSYSSALPPERQGESRHRYVLGLYHVLDALTCRFPNILFEACSSGGNRTDLGMLCYMPQVWLSDNTDALCRCRIQWGASFGYPQSVMGAHVSGTPNHQTLRRTPLDSRFHVAAMGLLGYECDLRELSSEEKSRVAGQIAFYKKYRQILQYGQFYRLMSGTRGIWQMSCVAENQKAAITLLFQQENHPNAPAQRLLAKGLNHRGTYRITVRPSKIQLKDFGGLVNMISPVHIRQGSLMESAAEKVMNLHSEQEDITASGDLLMTCGAFIKQGFSGTGWDNETRVMGDCGSRLYLLREK
ncbi:MAG: alpha-galactosidase [Oscillospiraceae bacterium]|nr:alpha-galactosidase [Oscillospiraceae bacterium]